MRKIVDRRILSATQEAKVARADVMATLNAVRHRLDPRVIASEAAEAAFTRATQLVEDVGGSAKARPWVLAIGATAFGLALTLRAKLSAGNRDDNDMATNPVSQELGR